MAASREQTITQTIRNYGDRLFRFIRGRVNSDEDAEDVLQDVWYQLSRIVDVSAVENINAWLHRVARNRLTDGYRKKRPEALEDLRLTDEDGEGSFLDDWLASDGDTPEEAYFRQIVWETLDEALDELPEAQRDVFVWNELEDETFQSISDRTGINIKTLISRKRYAVQHLRQRLADLHDELLNY
ncbi:MAG: sigma-70 family RNA polymerase sigma factor [Bacteroidota bacterium]